MQSSEEAPPETTEEKPSSKTPPPQQRSTSAPEASAPPPVRPHWPPLLVLLWSTGAGGMFSILLGKKTIYYRFEKRFFPAPPALASSSSRLPAREAICAPSVRKASRELWFAERRPVPGPLVRGGCGRRTERSWALFQASRPAARAHSHPASGLSSLSCERSRALSYWPKPGPESAGTPGPSRPDVPGRGPASGPSVPGLFTRLAVKTGRKHSLAPLREPGGGTQPGRVGGPPGGSDLGAGN